MVEKILTPRFPEWLSECPESYLYGPDPLGRYPLHRQILSVYRLFDDLGWPHLKCPPDQKITKGHYDGSWTWIWYLEQEKVDSPSIQLQMDATGRAKILFSAGWRYSNLTVVACSWGCDHNFKYGYISFHLIRILWEAISSHNLERFMDTIPKVYFKYYQNAERSKL